MLIIKKKVAQNKKTIYLAAQYESTPFLQLYKTQNNKFYAF